MSESIGELKFFIQDLLQLRKWIKKLLRIQKYQILPGEHIVFLKSCYIYTFLFREINPWLLAESASEWTLKPRSGTKSMSESIGQLYFFIRDLLDLETVDQKFP